MFADYHVHSHFSEDTDFPPLFSSGLFWVYE